MIELFGLIGTSQLKWIVVLIAIDVILGIIAALVKKDFRLGKVANFMVKPVLGYVFGFAVLTATAEVLPSLAFIVGTAFMLVVLALIGSIFDNLGRLGLPVPMYLKK